MYRNPHICSGSAANLPNRDQIYRKITRFGSLLLSEYLNDQDKVLRSFKLYALCLPLLNPVTHRIDIHSCTD